jgi:hypothetical protein
MAISDVRAALARGCLIPAHPLALTAARRLDERRQRALTRYYVAAGAGGVAVGVHTTQFAIRRPEVGLLRPVLELPSGRDRDVHQVLDPIRQGVAPLFQPVNRQSAAAAAESTALLPAR